jgi:trimeric autotransporter adhesin
MLDRMRYTCALMAIAATAWGQSFQGGIRGSIADPGGAAVAQAKVTLTDEGTGIARPTLTSTIGEYSFSAVNPATYTLVVQAPGFRTFEQKGVTVATQQFLTLDVKLEIGEVTQTVMVTEEVPLIESSNASTGQVIDRQKLVDLPNLGRNPFMMSKIAQNVVPAGNPNFNRMQDQSGSSQISIAGGPVRGNNYLLDGVAITDTQNRAVIIPTIESVQEVKIQANTYDAEMGRTGGGVFNTYMKSGANGLNGSLFGYMRETSWMANTYFNNRNGLPKVSQPFRNYGASVGGPVWIPKVYNGKNKTFFFLGAEAYRQTSSVSNEFAVPTAAEIAGDFSQSLSRAGGLQVIYDPLGGTRTPFAGNIIPASRLSTVGSRIAQTYPAGTRAPRFHGDNNISVASTQYDRADQLTGKFDHRVADWWNASLSYLHYGSREPGENWFGTISSPGQWLLARKVDATQINNLLTLGPTTVMTVRYGFNRFPNDNYQRSLGYNLGTLGFASSFINAVQRPTFPNITMETFSSLGVNNNQFDVYSSRNFMAGVSKFMGRHSLKTGFDYRRMRISGTTYGNNSGLFTFSDVFTRSTATSAVTGTGSDLASLLLGYPITATSDVGSKLYQYLDYYAGFVHDDFRVTSKLTLNLGLRYEYESGLKAVDNALIVGFDPNAVPGSGMKGGVMYAGQNGYPTETGNLNAIKLSPRIGVAYAMSNKMTLRGGYGLFWAPIPYTLQTPIGFTQNNSVPGSLDGNVTPSVALDNPYPNGLLTPVGSSLGYMAGAGTAVTVIDQNHRSPMVHQYSFDVQREVGWGTTVAVGYVGSLGRQMVLGMGAVNVNQLAPEHLSLGSTLNRTVPTPFYQAGGPGLVGARTISLSQALRPYPQFTSVNLNNVDHNRSRYDSLVVKAQKRATNGLSFVTTWTYAKFMDGSFGGPGNNLNTTGGVQDTYNLDNEYSLSIVHAPHRLATGFTYELPFGRGKAMLANNKVLDAIAGGWSVNAISVFQSGFPLAIRQQSNNNSAIGGLNQRPNPTGVSPEVEGSFAQRIDGWLNPAAFSQAPAFTFGNVSRTISMRGPGQANWDMSVFKTYTIAERFKAQFRAEALNAMNTPLFRSPETRVGNANFGRVTSQANFPRMLQLGVRLFF